MSCPAMSYQALCSYSRCAQLCRCRVVMVTTLVAHRVYIHIAATMLHDWVGTAVLRVHNSWRHARLRPGFTLTLCFDTDFCSGDQSPKSVAVAEASC